MNPSSTINTAPTSFARKLLTLTFALIVGTAMFAASASAQDQSAADADEPAVIGVKMYADWCGKCHVIDPKLDVVMPQFEGDDVLFVRFDFTNDFTTEQSKFLAQRLNLTDIFDEHVGVTGYMVLLDPETHEELARLTDDQSEDELQEQIQSTLAAQQ